MEDKELAVKVAEIDQRGKSNSHQIEDIKDTLDKHDGKIDKLQEGNVAIERLATIMDGMREDRKEQVIVNNKITLTLTELNNTMINTNSKVERLSQSQESFNTKIDKISIKVDEVDCKTKVDWAEFVSANWWKFVVAVCSGGGLITYIVNSVG